MTLKNGTRAEALALVAKHRTMYTQMPDNEAACVGIDTALLDGLTSLIVTPLTRYTVNEPPPDVDRVGLGYRVVFTSGVEMTLTRVRESRGEIHGELHVGVKGDDKAYPERHLFTARFNVSSITSRTSAAKYLASRMQADWGSMLERFCLEVLRLERKGEEFTTVGQSETQEPDRWLLKPLLLQRKTTIIFGAGGSWKSTVGAACAVQVTTGQDVVPGWKVQGEGKVLVLDWEDSSATWNERIRYIAIGAGVNPPEIHYRSMSRPLADEVESVANYIGAHGINLAIVDSVGLAMGATQDGDGVADGAFRLFAALRELRTTNLLIDHVAGAELGAKNGLSPKPYGSVYKQNLARSVFEIRSDKQVGEMHEIVLVHTKQNVARVSPQELSVEYGDGVIKFRREGVRTQEVMAALPVIERIFRVIDGGKTVQELADETGCSKAQIGQAMRTHKDRFVKLDGGRYGLSAQERIG